MLNLLMRIWLTGTHRCHRGRRRGLLTQHVGGIEQLEARTVLSASYGAALVGPQHVEISNTSWENGPPPETAAFHESADGIGSHPGQVIQTEFHDMDQWAMNGPRPMRDSYDAYGSVSTFDAPDFRGDMPAFAMPQKPFPLVQRWIVIVYSPPDFTGVQPNTGIGNSGVGTSIEDIESGLGPTHDLNLPAMIQAPTKPSSSGTQSNSVSKGPGVTQAIYHSPNGSPPRTSLNVSTTLPSLYGISEKATTEAKPTSPVSSSAHDAFFQDFSSRQLLLTAGASDSDDDDAEADVDGDPRRRSKDGPEDETSTLVHSGLRDDIAASLDTLQREREAIDRVLAGLHQPGQSADAHGPDATRTRPSTDTEPVFVAEDLRATSDHSANLPPVNDSGMVLLQASGDANSSAYDLTAAIATGVDHTIAMPIRAEAAVGVYQAFDVSGAESRPAETNKAPRDNSVAIGQSAAADSDAGA